MKIWIFISILAVVQLLVFAVGIPFQISVGRVQLEGSIASYMTTSRTLAMFILTAEKSELSCEKSPTVCVHVRNPEGIGPYMPIHFEACHPVDIPVVASCSRPQLSLNLNTAKWIQTSLGRRL